MNPKVKTLLSEPLGGVSIPPMLTTVFENINSAVAFFDVSGRLVHANAAMTALGRRTLGRPLAALADLGPNDRTSACFVAFERFRAGRLDELHERYEMLGGTVWVDLSLRRHRLETGEAPLTIANLIDVSGEHDALKKLEHSELRWETALEGAGQGLWEFDCKAGDLMVSRGWKRLRGIPDDEVVHFSREEWLSRLHPDDRDRVDTDSQKQGYDDGYDTLEYRERHRDGHYIWIYSRGRPYVWDEAGEVHLNIGTDTDITRLKTVEAELAVEKERLHVTLQSIADGVVSTDAKGNVTFINKAAEKMTGWAPGEALGQKIDDVLVSSPEGRAGDQVSLVAQCLERGRVCRASGYTRLKSRTGRSRYIREIATPVRTDQGKTIGAVMVFQNATERRRLQRELEYAATHDSLTGLVNRAALEARLEARVADARAGRGPHVLCLIDLDRFKAVNDGAGHAAGDALLKSIAQLIRSECRQNDCVARLGGDEFALVLDTCNIKTARQITSNIVERIDALDFEWQDQTFRIGASIGIAMIDGTATSAFELYRNADNACYAAKRNGRGRVVVFG